MPNRSGGLVFLSTVLVLYFSSSYAFGTTQGVMDLTVCEEEEAGGCTPRNRQAHYYYPDGIEGPRPLVILLHGSKTTAKLTIELYGWKARARKNKFLLVVPQGLDCPDGPKGVKGEPVWNNGLGKSCPNPEGDDVALIRELPRAARSLGFPVDERRIYVAGHSGGAIMAYRIACEASDLVAAVAAVAGVRGPGPCEMKEPVSIISLNTTGDTAFPYDSQASITKCLTNVLKEEKLGYSGSEPWEICFRGNSVGATQDIYAAANSCPREKATLKRHLAFGLNPAKEVLRYADCRGGSEVLHHKVYKEGFDAHFYWPGTFTREAWNFFLAHPKK